MMRRPHLVRVPAGVAAALGLAALPACDGCHSGKPYTPYTLSDPPATSSGAAAEDGGATAAGAAFVPVAASAAPGDGKSWPLGGGAAEPPAGHAFAEGLVVDADGDGKEDLIAFSRSPDGLRGEVWFAPGKSPGSGSVVAALPGDLASPGCVPKPSLSRPAPTLIALDVDPGTCPRAKERGSRWIAVFRFVRGGPPELGLELRVGAPADGESIAVSFDGNDRDGDGRADFTATLTLTGAPHPLPGSGSAAAKLAFFDRPAGLSRDPMEPEASLRTIASSLVADARKRTTAARVEPAGDAAERLYELLCDEGGKPAITTSAGPVKCGDVHLLEEAAIAETEAALNLGDPIAAMAALARVEGRRKDVDALVAKSIPSLAGKLVRTTAASPDVQPPPSFGPVAILPGGDILVRTRDKIVKVDHASFEEARVDAALSWPSRLAAGAQAPAWTLVAVEQRCDAPTLVGRFSTSGGEVEAPLPILTPPRCSPGARPSVDLLGSSAAGALLAASGVVVAIPREAPPRPAPAESLAPPPGATMELGAGRSPNGSVVALSTARGVLVASLKDGRAAHAKLWTAPALDGASFCVPNDDADRLACATKSAVAIYDAK